MKTGRKLGIIFFLERERERERERKSQKENYTKRKI